ncbi:MAG: hypothetical protein KA401_00115 [Anaerolineae bacterium]|nr:hypothetical protein [Anaerolineae bacterium]
MTDSTGGSLNAAYEAIKAKDLAKARDLLSAYLVDQPNDVDAWWLYSYAVTDVEQGRKALETVLRLDPAYPGARDLLTELENSVPSPATSPIAQAGIKSISRVSETAKLTATIQPDDDRAEFGFPDESKQETGRFSRMLLAVLAAIVVIGILLVVFVLPNLNNPQSTPVANATVAASETTEFGVATVPPTTGASVASTVEPTIAGQVTDAPTTESTTVEASTSEAATVDATSAEMATPEAVATTDPAVPTDTSVTAAGLEPVYEALSAFEVVPDSTVVESTEMGQTASVSICAVTSQLRTVVPAALTSLARVSTQLPAELQAVGAKFVECTGDNSVLRYVALTMADAQGFANGTLTETDLRARLVPLP